MVKGKVELKTDNLAKIMGGINALTKKDVLVGIPSEKATRTPDPEDPEPATNAELAYIFEYGAPGANIPARPHFIPTIKEQKMRIAQILQQAAKAALNGDAASVFRFLNAAGLFTSIEIKKKINEGLEPPLAASTLAARQREGFQGTKPLIRTGQYRNSITYVVRDKTQVDREKSPGGHTDTVPMVR